LGLIFIYLFANNLRLIFYLATIPGLLAVLLLILLVSEKKEVSPSTKTPQKFSFSWKFLNPKVKLFLLISFIFALGNSSDAFLILRAKKFRLNHSAGSGRLCFIQSCSNSFGDLFGKTI
jgi:hypothetical protein